MMRGGHDGRPAAADLPRMTDKIGDPSELTAIQALTAFREGRLTAVAYAQALLDRCREFGWLNAFIGGPSDALLLQARESDQRRRSGRSAGALDGLPILIKDNIDVAGWTTTAGTPGLEDHVPGTTAPVAAALFQAGALMLGKTNMHELAYGITSNNGAFGPVRNPYGVRRIAGGSSGGTGAAIAARMGAAGLGSDTGGSVRIPAALCGIAGLRPTIRRYAQAGIVPISHSRDTAGPMARSVADLALLDGVITGETAPLVPVRLKDLRLGVPRQSFFEMIEPDVLKVIEDVFRRLQQAGVTLVEAELEGMRDLLRDTGRAIAFYETPRDMATYLAGSGAETTLDRIVEALGSPDVAAIFADMRQNPVSQDAYRAAREDRMPRVQALFQDYFAGNDLAAIIFPATALPACPIGDDDQVSLCGRSVSTFAAYLRNTEPASIAGLPGIALPAGLSPGGLPIGIELDGPAGSDRGLLAIAAAIEPFLAPLPAPTPNPAQLR